MRACRWEGVTGVNSPATWAIKEQISTDSHVEKILLLSILPSPITLPPPSHHHLASYLSLASSIIKQRWTPHSTRPAFSAISPPLLNQLRPFLRCFNLRTPARQQRRFRNRHSTSRSCRPWFPSHITESVPIASPSRITHYVMGNFPGYLLGLRHCRLPSPLLTTLSLSSSTTCPCFVYCARTIDCYVDEVRSIFSKVTNLYHSDLALWYLFEDCRFIPIQLLLVVFCAGNLGWYYRRKSSYIYPLLYW